MRNFGGSSAAPSTCCCLSALCELIGYSHEGMFSFPVDPTQRAECARVLGISSAKERQKIVASPLASSFQIAPWHIHPRHRYKNSHGKWRIRTESTYRDEEGKVFRFPPPNASVLRFIDEEIVSSGLTRAVVDESLPAWMPSMVRIQIQEKRRAYAARMDGTSCDWCRAQGIWCDGCHPCEACESRYRRRRKLKHSNALPEDANFGCTYSHSLAKRRNRVDRSAVAVTFDAPSHRKDGSPSAASLWSRRWSTAEDLLILRVLSARGGGWTGDAGDRPELASLLPGRTREQIRDRWVNVLGPARVGVVQGVGRGAELGTGAAGRARKENQQDRGVPNGKTEAERKRRADAAEGRRGRDVELVLIDRNVKATAEMTRREDATKGSKYKGDGYEAKVRTTASVCIDSICCKSDRLSTFCDQKHSLTNANDVMRPTAARVPLRSNGKRLTILPQRSQMRPSPRTAAECARNPSYLPMRNIQHVERIGQCHPWFRRKSPRAMSIPQIGRPGHSLETKAQPPPSNDGVMTTKPQSRRPRLTRSCAVAVAATGRSPSSSRGTGPPRRMPSLSASSASTASGSGTLFPGGHGSSVGNGGATTSPRTSAGGRGAETRIGRYCGTT